MTSTRALVVVREATGPGGWRSARRRRRADHGSHPFRFALGDIAVTPAALAALARTRTNAVLLLARHATGDWDELRAEDREANERAVATGWRILSEYRVGPGECIWLLTEAARSVTTILLPSDY
jgi:hypothetical protein